jgi:hypothetical protein
MGYRITPMYLQVHPRHPSVTISEQNPASVYNYRLQVLETFRKEKIATGWGDVGKLTIQTPEILFRSINTLLSLASCIISEADIQFRLPFRGLKV